MNFIKNIIFTLFITHAVKVTCETSSDEVEEQSERYVTSTETSTTTTDELERPDPNSESIEETTFIGIINGNETVVDVGISASSDEEKTENYEHTESIEDESSVTVNINDTDSSKTTMSRTTTTVDTLSLIEVEEKTAQQTYNGDVFEVTELSRSRTEINESKGPPASVKSVSSDSSVNDTNTSINVPHAENTDVVACKLEKSSNGGNVEVNEKSSSTTTGRFVRVFKLDDDNPIKKPSNSRRMLNEPRTEMSFEIRTESVTPVPQSVSSMRYENLGLLRDHNIGANIRFALNANTVKTTPLIPTLLTKPLSNNPSHLRYNPIHSYYSKPSPSFDLLTNHGQVNTASAVPLFRVWNQQPTRLTLLQLTQPYLISSPPPPVPFQNAFQDEIFVKLSQATLSLHEKLANQYSDWYRSK